jgi:rRNA-processing protein FCF1
MVCATIDTNTFIYAYLNKIDLFLLLEEAGIRKMLIPSKLVEELGNLESKLRGEEKRAVKFTKVLIREKCRIVDVNASDVDSALLKLAKSYDCVLITSDRVLGERAKKEGVEIAFIRSKRKIEFSSGYNF